MSEEIYDDFVPIQLSELDDLAARYFLENRQSSIDYIMGVWLDTKKDIWNFDKLLCESLKISHHVLLGAQTRMFLDFLNTLDDRNIFEFRKQVESEADELVRNLKKGLSPFSNRRSSSDSYSQELLTRKLKFIFEQIVGETYHVDILMSMYQIRALTDLSEIRFMHLVHAEVLDVQKIQKLLTLFQVVACTELTDFLRKIPGRYDGPIEACLGYKHDNACTLKILPKDIIKKIVHRAAGTEAVGKIW